MVLLGISGTAFQIGGDNIDDGYAGLAILYLACSRGLLVLQYLELCVR